MPAPSAYEDFLSGVHSANWLARRPRAARIGEDGPSEQWSCRLAGVVVGVTFSLGVAVVGEAAGPLSLVELRAAGCSASEVRAGRAYTEAQLREAGLVD